MILFILAQYKKQSLYCVFIVYFFHHKWSILEQQGGRLIGQ